MTTESQHTQSPYDWMARLARLRKFACVVVDEELNILHFDDALLSLAEVEEFGVISGDSLLDVIGLMAARGDFGPGNPEIYKSLMKAAILEGVSLETSRADFVRLQTPSGRRLKFSQAAGSNGEILFICEDESESYIKQHALRIAMESSGSGYVVYDMQTNAFRPRSYVSKTRINESIQAKVAKDGLAGLLHPDDADKCLQAFKQSLKDRQPFDVTVRVKNESVETRWIRASATPQISEAGVITAYIVFYTEVTAQLRIQTELNLARQQAEKALAAKNSFLARLSHEIRTPMNAVVGIADALVYHNADETISPKLKLIQNSADKIVRIVDESLQHTKLAEQMVELNPQTASPATSVSSVCALWEEKAKTNAITLTCTIGPNVPATLHFDDHRYEQCLNNLLSNAVKFAPGGRIDVILTTLPHESGDRLVLAVKDTGIGMSEAQVKSLFDAYTQADKSIAKRFGGTGLGMNITKQIIELMGGRVSVKSVIGDGTVIALTLPMARENRQPKVSHTSAALVSDMIESATPVQSDYANLRVLVVDDNPTNHIVVTSLLESLVASIVTADNGEEAIERLQTQAFDVVLMDIHMPVMDGIEATLSIRGSGETWSDVPIIALTADPQYQQKRLCRNIGMNNALGKPFKLNELLNMLDEVINPAESRDAA